MTEPLVPVGDGHTELTDDEREGLLPSYITTRGELNEAEQRNIATGTLRRRPPSADKLLDDTYLRALHKAMFGQVWSWAGQYRRRETNVGIDPTTIGVAVRDLTHDVRAWIEHETYSPDEITVRFHHRLVAIHPFPNGNGRHGRVAADYLVRALDQECLTWGANLRVSTEELRRRYLTALRAADRGDLSALLSFARS